MAELSKTLSDVEGVDELLRNLKLRYCWASGGIGRRARLKIWFSQGSGGSSPPLPTNILIQ